MNDSSKGTESDGDVILETIQIRQQASNSVLRQKEAEKLALYAATNRNTTRATTRATTSTTRAGTPHDANIVNVVPAGTTNDANIVPVLSAIEAPSEKAAAAPTKEDPLDTSNRSTGTELDLMEVVRQRAAKQGDDKFAAPAQELEHLVQAKTEEFSETIVSEHTTGVVDMSQEKHVAKGVLPYVLDETTHTEASTSTSVSRPTGVTHVQQERLVAIRSAREVPGAYAQGGIDTALGQTTTRTTRTDRQPSVDQNNVATTGNFSSVPPSLVEEGVAQAILVEEDDHNMMEAQPVDVDALERQRSEKRQKLSRNLQGMAGTFLVVLLVALVLGLVFRSKDPAITIAPTVAPSMVPTSAPSEAPTGALDIFMDNLPQYTLDSLDNSSSYQWKAREWLSRHPELPTMEEWRKLQLFALASFFHSMEGESWNPDIQERWMIYENECLWFSSAYGMFDAGIFEDGYDSVNFLGVEVCNEKEEFQALVLWQLDLTFGQPIIPPEISLLTSLQYLGLGWNNISTSVTDLVPTELGLIPGLETLSLWNNDFTGTLPSTLGLLSSLTNLDVADNYLTGSLPQELFELPLSGLDVSDNQLSGPLPSELGMLSLMTWVNLYYNQFTGSLPTEIGLMSALSSLWLGYNPLTGTIPSELGQLSIMTTYRLDGNGLTGHIPSEVGLLTSLTSFHLEYNLLSGSLPSELGLQPSLDFIAAFDNELTGSIPARIGYLPLLRFLKLSDNNLTGSIPELNNIVSWDHKGVLVTLQNNELSGVVPESLCTIGQVSYWGLGFDCNGMLCGCDWCPCQTNITNSTG